MLLLVEGDPDLGAALQEGLSAHFNCLWTRTLEDARLAVAANRFELAIIDLGLADGSGQDLVHELRRSDSETLAIVLTANDRREDRLAALRGGAADYIGKPFDLDELVTRCHAAIRRKLGKDYITTIRGLGYVLAAPQ